MINSRRHLDIIAKFFIVTFSVLFSLFSIEGIARLKYNPHQIIFKGFFEYDPQTIYRFKSNMTGVYADKEFKTNADGYRGEFIPVKKDANEWRVVFLGDSITFGHGVENDQTFAYQYQASLSAQISYKKITSINTGVPGYSDMQEYYEFTKALKFKPNVSIIQFALNDINEPYFFQKNLGGIGFDYHEVEDISYWHFYLSQRSALYLFLLDLSKLVKFGTTNELLIRSKAETRIRTSDALLVDDQHSPLLETMWSTYFSWLKKYVNLCEVEKIACYILISPSTFQLEHPYTDAFQQQRLIAFARQNHIESIDMLQVLQGKIKQLLIEKYKLPGDIDYSFLIAHYMKDIRDLRKIYFIDNDHYTPLGHSLVNEQLLNVIVKPE